MKISTRSQYGLRAMLELALRFGENPVLMETIAKSQELSPKYLHSLLTILKTNGFIRTIRGVGGGYILTKPPSQIKVSDIIRVLEGSLSIIECVDDEKACKKIINCVTREVWNKVGKSIEEVLSSCTLEDLVKRKKEKEGEAPDYSI